MLSGSVIFYATHQFFLTEDALYIICWTADENTAAYRLRDADELPDEGKNQPREYWLENIRHRGGPNCPVLMVQTHFETDKASKALNAVDIQREYGAVCLDFSAKTDQGLENLQALIAQKLNREVPFFGRKVPESYDNLIAAIEQMNPDGTKISLDFFRQELCPVAGVPTGDEIEALHFLRKTGAVVWFHEVDDLSNTIFINPDWLTKQVYRLINRKLNERRGRISPDYLADVFSDFSPEERGQFLELLKNFKLIFEVKDKAVHIAPQYLPAELDLDGQDALAIIENRLETAFVFAFPKFLPDNVMINFLSHYGPFSKNLFWKNGICFQNQQGQNCLVRLLEGNRLEVMAEPGEQSFALQAEVCRAFVELSKKANAEVTLEGRRVSWQKLMKARQDKMLEIYDEDENKVQTAHFDRFFVRYSLEAESGAFEVKGGDVFFTHSRMEADLREGPKSDGPTPSQPIAPPPPQPEKHKIYFSYAWGDPDEAGESREKIVDELYESLTQDGFDVRRDKMSLEYGGLISAFMGEIGTGLVVVFVSDKYARSPYCMNELFEIARNSKLDRQLFSERVMPVAVERIKFDDPDVLEIYFDHWEKEESKWVAFVQKRISQVTEAQTRRLHITKKIRQHSGDLYDWLTDMNAKTNALLRDNDFAEVKKRIIAQTQKLQNGA